MYQPNDHTFVLCAYKVSPYLEECIQSLRAQTVKSKILIATSTPNAHIQALSEKYGLPLYLNKGIKGIGGDWNFAYSQAKTPLITIAHQDDTYEPEYTETILRELSRAKDPILAFSDYYELRCGVKAHDTRLLKIKRLLLTPLKPRAFQSLRLMKRLAISLGDPICCPAVTFVRERVGENPFTNDFLSDIDWQQWELQSKKKGAFVYCQSPLMCHRIHEESATSSIIGENKRSEEDYQMYLKFWCKPVAKLLMRFYAKSQESNQVDKLP